MARRTDATCSARVIARINGCALQRLSTAPMNEATPGRAPESSIGRISSPAAPGMPLRIALLVGLLTSSALAQPVTPVPPPTPFQPKVEDPMLAPAPPAPRQVANWDEALALVKERSTDLDSARAGVER